MFLLNAGSLGSEVTGAAEGVEGTLRVHWGQRSSVLLRVQKETLKGSLGSEVISAARFAEGTLKGSLGSEVISAAEGAEGTLKGSLGSHQHVQVVAALLLLLRDSERQHLLVQEQAAESLFTSLSLLLQLTLA